MRTLRIVTLVGTALSCVTAASAVRAPTTSPVENEPTPCAAIEVRSLVTSFIRAFNGGDSELLDRLYAKAPDFKWYSTGGPGVRLAPAAMDRSSLVRYFARRHARGERLTLRTFRFNGNTNTPPLKPYGNFVFTLTRRASDLRPTPYHGKGAAHCYPGDDVIIVWSMARRVR
jgi:hypothetical protein